jgi:dUTP pyrophosphatase
MKIKVVNSSGHPLPAYKTNGSAGLDLSAHLDRAVELQPGEIKLIATGLSLELPLGYEAQVRPRSGWALKSGVTVLNSPGTIDADYRGEVGVILINHGKAAVSINNGDRIAQLVVAKHERVEWDVSNELSISERGAGGFGSTGI